MPVSAYSGTDGLPLKPVEWMGSSRSDLRAMPEAVRDGVGYGLYLAQSGKEAPRFKRLRGDLSGLIEIVEDHDGNAYRAVYTVRFQGAVYVLHVFQKKSTHGIATPRRVIKLIRQRLALARHHHTNHYGAKEDS